jgi:predicted negative regulator of RcsB-dependent stress response
MTEKTIMRIIVAILVVAALVAALIVGWKLYRNASLESKTYKNCLEFVNKEDVKAEIKDSEKFCSCMAAKFRVA